MIEFRMHLENLIPTKKFFVDTLLIVISYFIVKFILSFTGVPFAISQLPSYMQTAINIGLAIYLRQLVDLVINGRDFV